MEKIIEVTIDKCRCCFYMSSDQRCKKNYNHNILDKETIPIWCPLPDAEPGVVF